MSAPELWVSCPRCRALHDGGDAETLHDAICEGCRMGDATDDERVSRFHRLDDATIASAVRRTAPGSYALGYLDGGEFTVFYVGRSDTDVASDLGAWVGAPSHPGGRRASPRSPWQSSWRPPRSVGLRAVGPGTSADIDTGYTHFAFLYAASAIEAFERECREYHEHGGREELDNGRHPLPPQGSVPCPCPVHGP